MIFDGKDRVLLDVCNELTLYDCTIISHFMIYCLLLVDISHLHTIIYCSSSKIKFYCNQN
jgi:hypothetical protein